MIDKSVIGGAFVNATPAKTDEAGAYEKNTEFWDSAGSEFLGVTALPDYGAFGSEEKLQLLGNLSGKRVLEIDCGSGRSLEYIHKKGAAELWGIDISQKQLERSENYLAGRNIHAKLVCSPMENSENIPKNYFDLSMRFMPSVGQPTLTELSETSLHTLKKTGCSFSAGPIRFINVFPSKRENPFSATHILTNPHTRFRLAKENS